MLVVVVALNGTTVALAQTQDGRQACMNDAFQFCEDAIPDRERVFQCLASHKDLISAACRTVMAPSLPVDQPPLKNMLLMRRAPKAKQRSPSALQRLYPGMIGKLIMQRAQKAKRLSPSALQRLCPGMIEELLMRRAQKAKRLSPSVLQRLCPGMIGKLLMRRAQKATRLSPSVLQRLCPGMIGIPLILCPTKPGPHATSAFRGKAAVTWTSPHVAV